MSRSTTHKASPQDVVLIGRDTEDGPEHFLYQDRVLYEPTPEEVEAAASGVPIFYATKLPGHDKPVVVAGRGRVVAARLAGLEEVEFKLVKGSPIELVALMIKENALHRPPTPMDKAKDAQKLLAMHEAEGVDKKEALKAVANAFGQSVQSIKNYLQILSFTPEVQQAIEERKISADVALTTFRKVDPEEQPKVLEQVLEAPQAPAPSPKAKAKGKKEPAKRNMDKAILKWMANDEASPLMPDEEEGEEDPVSLAALYVLWMCHGMAQKAKVFRHIPKFKSAYDRAKRALNKETS